MGCGCVRGVKRSYSFVPQKDLDGKRVAAFSKEDLLDYEHTGESKLQALSDEEFEALVEEALHDPRTKYLDANTKLFRTLVGKINAVNKEKVKPIYEICEPKEKAKLEFFTLEGIQGMKVPDDDEDWPHKGKMQKHFSGIAQGTLLEFLKRLPCSDVPAYFDSVEEGILLGQVAMDGVLPQATERFPDLVSDEAMGLIAFWGLGQLFLEGTPAKEPGGKPPGFDCDVAFLDGLQTRGAYEDYGATAHFDENCNIESIYWCYKKKTCKPGDIDWEHAKWVWKVSLGAATTAVTHLVQLHWIVVNATHVACRQELSARHPIRRVLKVFLYNTGGVNFGSTMSLYPANSFLHRMSALTYDGLVDAINYGDKCFKYETHPEFVARKNLGKDMESKLPMCVDGLKVWWAFHKFFSAYVELYYSDDKTVTEDAELVAYWRSVESRGGHGSPYKYGLPPLSRAALIDQMTHHAFFATCWHEFVGAIVHYLTTPEGLGTKINPGKEVMDVQTFVQGLCLIALTGTRQPQLVPKNWKEENWKHLLPKEAHQLHDEFMADLERISAEIDALNLTAPCPNRMRASNSFNPQYFECSVSV